MPFTHVATRRAFENKFGEGGETSGEASIPKLNRSYGNYNTLDLGTGIGPSVSAPPSGMASRISREGIGREAKLGLGVQGGLALGLFVLEAQGRSQNQNKRQGGDGAPGQP
jgi:hypothetical protein